MPPSTWETRMASLIHYRRVAWLSGMLGIVRSYDHEPSLFDLAHTALD